MRDIRGDLKERAALLEEEIEAAEAKFEKLVAQYRREHNDKLSELTAELEAVNKLMDLERRWAVDRVSKAETEHQRPELEAKPYRHARSAPEVEHRRAPQAERRRTDEMEPRRAPEMERRMPEIEELQPEQEVAPASLAAAQKARPRPQQPLADFLIRALNEVGTVSRDELCHFALREGYFDDSDTAIRAVHATLVNLARSDRIQQLPDGMFAPASLSQTLRLRRAM